MIRKIIDGNEAASLSAYYFTENALIYPITPSSPMASNIDNLSNKGEVNIFNDTVKVVEMQSEAGAIGALHGSIMSGSLSTTFTASQGLLLMIPNMYKIAGECLPAVIHVAARTVATHALSIFGDHSDIYATRQTGFCMLASSNVEEANHLAAVAHASAIKGSLPFIHFFDGFRTSHEINTVNILSKEELRQLITDDEIKNFKEKALNVDCNFNRGMNENEDIYFQSLEARNPLYNKMPEIVEEKMNIVNELMGTDYKPFNYYGYPSAEHVIVAMGSVCETIKNVIDNEIKNGESIGLIEVHLYRPFSVEYLKKVLPKSVKNIAVLDRTKEPGSIGEPLYLDIVTSLKNTDIKVVGGRYGISSKNTTPAQIKSVFNMLKGELKEGFTIGIKDDVTYTSLEEEDYKLNLDVKEIKIYGFGSDGMVSTSKNIMKLIGSRGKYVQNYNQYDSKKSGGVTISNLRISDSLIRMPYYVQNPSLVIITKDEYLHKYKIVEDMLPNSTLIINTNSDNLDAFLPLNVKMQIQEKNIKVKVIDADKIAITNNIKGKISKIMEIIILNELGIEDAYDVVINSIKEKFKTKGEDIISSNIKSVDEAMSNLVLVDYKFSDKDINVNKSDDVFSKIRRMEGNDLSVKELSLYKDGRFPSDKSKYEKRNIAPLVPKWNSEKCIQCGMCSFVCPHAVIRPFVSDNKEDGIPFMGADGKYFTIQISERDCTSCGLCVSACSAKGLEFKEFDPKLADKAEEYFNNNENELLNIPKFTVKGSQLRNPKFQFSGACAGCGETPYIKLLTQLFGDSLVIANATGCSSIYGGLIPGTPYSIPWANSLFEDNAEFSYGIYLSYKNIRNRIKNEMLKDIDNVSSELKEIYNMWIENMEDAAITRDVYNKLLHMETPKYISDNINYIKSRDVWAVGGDGWAYDIGFGGLDHILNSNERVRILVLDTEVYSNTGGQASKSSQKGAVCEFSDGGKITNKKDLFKIAMNYENCYVASVAIGANPMHTIKSLKEASLHDGPSIIICYAPCIEQGIKGGMSNSVSEQKLAVECGYVNLMRYNPVTKKLILDSKNPDFSKYHDFLMNEVRYSSLVLKNKEEASKLLNSNMEYAKNRFEYYYSICTKK